MIIVRLKGGMGNQMFQYAFGRSLSILKNVPLVIDKRYLEDRTPRKNFTFRDYDLDIFNIFPVFKEGQISYSPNKLTFRAINKFYRMMPEFISVKTGFYREKSFSFNERFTRLPQQLVVDGYFQSYKYFEAVKDVILNDFTFRNPIADDYINLLTEIKSVNSICVHVRRGDFLTDPMLGAKDGSYYSKAAEFMLGNVPDPHFYVFSDDIDWCEKNLKFSGPTRYIKDLPNDIKLRSYFEVMINCKHFIIPNSSFSWWAAYLSPNENKVVVAPALWFNDANINTDDLIPANWTRL